jgi:hypothetical protein
VRITGWWRETPRLRLLGRTGIGSDLCGEKLTEAFVHALLGGAGRRLPRARLVPQALPSAHYRLLLDAAQHDVAGAGQLAAATGSAAAR